MPTDQGHFDYSAPSNDQDQGEVDRERRFHERVARATADAVDEIGRKIVCYALEMSESVLSRQLSGADNRVLDFRVVLYAMKRQSSERLARILAEYSGFAPFQRPDALEPEEEIARIRAALHRHGAFGQHVLEEALGSANARRGKP